MFKDVDSDCDAGWLSSEQDPSEGAHSNKEWSDKLTLNFKKKLFKIKNLPHDKSF